MSRRLDIRESIWYLTLAILVIVRAMITPALGADSEKGTSLETTAEGVGRIGSIDAAIDLLLCLDPPHLISVGCATETGWCVSAKYLGPEIISYWYVKNIGGSGLVDVAIRSGEYIENLRVSVQSDTQYALVSRIPTQRMVAGFGFDLSVTFGGDHELTLTRWINQYEATGKPSSTLVLDHGQFQVEPPVIPD